MTAKTPDPATSDPGKKITFYDAHYPVLKDGEYTFSFEQTLKIDGVDIKPGIQPKTVTFHVDGPRFQLNSNHIISSFPPNAGKGDFMAVLPTLVLDRSTLPWERTPLKPSSTDYSENLTVKNSSWLFLLLLDEDELSSDNVSIQKNASLPELVQSLSLSEEDQKLLELENTDLSHLPPTLDYLKINQPFLAASGMPLIPRTLSELQYLSYARIKGNSEEEHAVLLCNRLPKKGSNSTVYLISLENNYQEGTDGSFEFQGLTSGSDYIFPYLYKWEFHTLDDQLYCLTSNKVDKIESNLSSGCDVKKISTIFDQVFTTKESFEAKLKSSSLGVTKTTDLNIIENASKVPGSNFHEIISNLDGGFEPLANPVQSNPISNSGSLNLKYLNGSESNGTNTKITAYYRSPLAASPIDLSSLTKLSFASGNFPVQASDLEIIFNGEKDLTYSSAFELGRLTALDDVDFANEFYKWKSEYAVATRVTSATNALSYLAVSDVNIVPEMPKHIKDKFIAWKQLKGIPYRYLVPDPSLLPNESIRFFHVDQNWIKAFICGAFSLGHTIEFDFTDELTSLLSFESVHETVYKNPQTKKDPKTITITFPKYGFLINSFAVSGWPGYEVDASNVEYTKDNIKDKSNLIGPPSRSKLDTNIELFLYTEQFKGLNFHLHPGKSYSGFLAEEEKVSGVMEAQLWKINYFSSGDTIPSGVQLTQKKDHVIISSALKNVIDIKQLTDSLNISVEPKTKTKSIAEFAGKMLEGTPEVYFNIS